MFTAALFTIAKYGSNLRVHQQMNKEEAKKKAVKKKNEILSFPGKWINQQGIIFSEIGPTEKDKQCVISHVESKTTRNQRM